MENEKKKSTVRMMLQICLLPAVGGRTQEAPKSKPDILMATEEKHNCRPVKESAYLKECNTPLSCQTAATVNHIVKYVQCQQIYMFKCEICSNFEMIPDSGFHNSYLEALKTMPWSSAHSILRRGKA